MNDFLTSKGLGLSLSGLRVGPLDPKSRVPKVGQHAQYQTEDPTLQRPAKFLNKERSGFSGGFKIPEEQRRAKLGRKIKHQDGDDSEDQEEVNKNDITKDEIMQHLNLGSSQATGGMGKHGTGSKTALTKDLIENLEKELEKLKRTEENIKVRKHIALKGDRSILDETEEDRQRAKDAAIKDEMKMLGNNVIHADQKRIQVMRHRVGQLDSVKSVPYEELEAMRTETAARLKVLEEQYWGHKDTQEVGAKIREKYKSYGESSEQDDHHENMQPQKTAASTPSILKKTPKTAGSLAKPKFDHRNLNSDVGKRSHSRTKKQRSPSPLDYKDPRQQIYEAKYEKYLANKKVKKEHEKKRQSMTKEEFDIYTKGPSSPSKYTKRFRPHIDPTDPKFSGKYNPDELLLPGYDKTLLNEAQYDKMRTSKGDPFKSLGIGSEDKMTFFLLKWVFNAIKRDSDNEDPTFQGKPYISKTDLVKQLSKNPELLHALGYEDQGQLSDNVKVSASKKEGYLMWSEFLDFFFLRDSSLQDRIDGNDWWNQLDSKGNYMGKTQDDAKTFEIEEELDDKENTDAQNLQKSPGQLGQRSYADRRPVKMTASLKMLQQTRANRTELEVEDEFKLIAADKKAKQGQPSPSKSKNVPEYESLDTDLNGEGFGFSREKSKNLLLSSQIEIMREVFEKYDKYNEGILRRSDFVMALRTDTRVIDFIDCEAVKKPYSKSTLTLDSVFLEIEKDERYDVGQQTKNEINHKEFITWREFLNYFNDYQEIEQRNRKQSQMQQTQKALKKENGGEDTDAAANEIKTLMEQEKDRRLEELPKIRAADQIDISEKQLQLVKDIYDSVPRAISGKDAVNVLTFFLTIRKDPQIRAINTAIARDPEGCSRIPRETFQEVFDRMERELQQKHVDWSVIVEFFTKRGRPLSKDEILKLVDEDRKERENEQSKKRADEEAERRRNQRIMGELEEDEDYEAFELRQKAEQTMGDIEKEDFDKKHGAATLEPMIEDFDLDRDEEFSANEDEFENTKDTDLENLSKTKLTQSDYLQRAESAKVRGKGKYGVTVPKPFAFDTRDKVQKKSIRAQKIEDMVLEKRIMEDALVKHQFRSKPVPPEVSVPRYQNIIEADEARRNAVRSQSLVITRSREQPFSFWEREKGRATKRQAEIEEHETLEMRRPTFRANPIPRACSVLIFAKKVKQDELKRGERIRKNAEIAFAKAKMPPTMQKYADRKKQEPPKKPYEEYTFKPDIGPNVTGKMLQEKAERFQRELAKKKGQKTQTQPRSPNFVKRSSKILERSYVNEGEIERQEDKYAEAMKKLSANAKNMEGTQQTNPSSTKAVAMSQAKRRSEIQEKRKKEEEEKKLNEDRVKVQNQLKGTVQGALKSKFEKSSSAVIKEQSIAKRKMMRQQEEQQAKVLEAAIKKGRNRPMLHEQSASDHAASSNLAYLKATQKMIELLKQNGEKPDNYLPDKARELLEEDKLRTQLKEKYNNGRK